MAINWALYTEKATGQGHPTNPDVINRPLRNVLTDSGYAQDGSDWSGFAKKVHTHLTADITDLATAATGITKIGTLTAGAVPASLVPPGAFASGTYTIPGTLVLGTDPANTATYYGTRIGGRVYLAPTGQAYSDTNVDVSIAYPHILKVTPSYTTAEANGSVNAIRIENTVTGTTYTGGTVAGLYSKNFWHGSAEVSHLLSVVCRTYNDGTGIADLAVGCYADYTLDGGGTMTQACNFMANSSVVSAGNVVTAYGLYINDATVSGTRSITTDYGIYVRNIASGTTTNVGIYVEGGGTYGIQNQGTLLQNGYATFNSSVAIGTTPNGTDLFQVWNGHIYLNDASGTASFKINNGQNTWWLQNQDLGGFPANATLTLGIGGTPTTKWSLDAGGKMTVAGSVIVGTDPTGAELLRVGGGARLTGTLVTTAASVNGGTVVKATGDPTHVIQWQLGDAGAFGSIGTHVSDSGLVFATNAVQTINTDQWTQSAATSASVLIRSAPNSPFLVYRAAAGVAAAGLTTFWGTPLFQIDTNGAIYPGGNIVMPSDNSKDLGSSSARVRSGYFGTSVVIGTDPTGAQALRVGGALRINSGTLISTATSFTNGAGVQSATLTNAPVAGNPTKWIPIDDNGTTRYVPAW